MGLGLTLPLLFVTSSSFVSPTSMNNYLLQSQTIEIEEYIFEYSNLTNNIIDRSSDIYNEESDTLIPVIQKYNDNICSKIKEIIGDNEVNFSNENYAYFYLNELRKTPDYESLLVNNNILFDDVIKSILLYLSTIDFENLFAFEEKFVINVLLNENQFLQEYALNTILNWDNISDIEILKEVKISNKYLNEDLHEFIDMFV